MQTAERETSRTIPNAHTVANGPAGLPQSTWEADAPPTLARRRASLVRAPT